LAYTSLLLGRSSKLKTLKNDVLMHVFRCFDVKLSIMRTTLTFDPSVDQLVRDAVYRSGKTFKQTVNDAIRAGLAPKATGDAPPFVFPSANMGREQVDLTKALSLAAELEDAERWAQQRLVQGKKQ
jgi:hypothetical protein